MSKQQSRRTLCGAVLAAGLLPLPAAWAQAFPARAITLVAPYSAGGPADTTARRLAEQMSRLLAQPVMVENRLGAAGAIAASYVAKAPKDGYTLFFAPGTVTAANPFIYKSLPYKLEDFAAVAPVSKQPSVLTVAPGLPVRSFPELLRYARSSENGISFASTGIGSATHVIGEWIGRTAGVKMSHIPYKGTAQSMADLISGRVDTQVEGLASAIPMHRSGKTRVIGILSEERSAMLPDVPTFREMGYPTLVAYGSFGLLAPAGTPDAVLEKLHTVVVAITAMPEFVSKLAESGEVPVRISSRQAYASFLQEDQTRWGEIIKPMHLEPQ